MGISIISSLTMPHLRNASSFLATRSACTRFILNKRNDSQMATSVNTSIVHRQRNSACKYSVQSPVGSTSVSNSTARRTDVASRLQNNTVNMFLTCLIYSFLLLSILQPLNGVRFRIDRPNVTSSAYSSSSPTEMPRAIMLSFTL